MATYTIKAQRYLRKYSAAEKTPVYSASVDVKTVVRSLCSLPWLKVVPADARMTYHTEENVGTDDNPVSGLDANVSLRDQFDAALFCSGHESGQHLAHANAAVYVYKLPDAAVGISLSSATVSVTSDPYNAGGARIHLATNSTGVIPTSCRDCRGEDASGSVVDDGTTASAVAPRTSSTVSGKTYWYPTSADVTLSPTGGLVLQKYLFVFVLLENYNTVRGNWIEGCSFIENAVQITTASAVPDWTDGGTVDLSEDSSSHSFAVCSGGVLPYIPAGSKTGRVSVALRADANLLAESDGSVTPDGRAALGLCAAAALCRLYALLYSGDTSRESAESPEIREGAYFNFSRATESHVSDFSDEPEPTDTLRLDVSSLVIPCAAPASFAPSAVRLDFDALSLPDGARFNVFVAPSSYLLALADETLAAPGLYDAENPPLSLLGSITGGSSATFDLPSSVGRVFSLVVSGFFPPEKCSLSSSAVQGTGSTPFLPDVTLLA